MDVDFGFQSNIRINLKNDMIVHFIKEGKTGKYRVNIDGTYFRTDILEYWTGDHICLENYEVIDDDLFPDIKDSHLRRNYETRTAQ